MVGVKTMEDKGNRVKTYIKMGIFWKLSKINLTLVLLFEVQTKKFLGYRAMYQLCKKYIYRYE